MYFQHWKIWQSVWCRLPRTTNATKGISLGDRSRRWEDVAQNWMDHVCKSCTELDNLPANNVYSDLEAWMKAGGSWSYQRFKTSLLVSHISVLGSHMSNQAILFDSWSCILRDSCVQKPGVGVCLRSKFLDFKLLHCKNCAPWFSWLIYLRYVSPCCLVWKNKKINFIDPTVGKIYLTLSVSAT